MFSVIRSKPVLSICIPTFNRAGCLENLLSSLVEDCFKHLDELEVIISDNASTDTTSNIADKFSNVPNFTWYQQDSNVGGPANVAYCCQQLARGEFCWVIGDDDLLLAGSITRILGVLKKFKQCNVFFINFAYVDYEIINRFASCSNHDFLPDCNGLESEEKGSRLFDSVIDFLQTGQGRIDYFSALLGLVIRTDLWKECSLCYKALIVDDLFQSFEISFPHLAPVFTNLSKSAVYYFDEPACLLGMGVREWGEQWSRVVSNQFPRFIEQYSENGASEDYIGLMRNNLVELLFQDLPRQIQSGMPWGVFFRPLLTHSRQCECSFVLKLCLKNASKCCLAILIRMYAGLPQVYQTRWRCLKGFICRN